MFLYILTSLSVVGDTDTVRALLESGALISQQTNSGDIFVRIIFFSNNFFFEYGALVPQQTNCGDIVETRAHSHTHTPHTHTTHTHTHTHTPTNTQINPGD